MTIHHLIVNLPVSKLVKVELREICHNVTTIAVDLYDEGLQDKNIE